MLLESALAELCIDLESDPQIYVDRVVLEMCSPSESLSDQKSPPSSTAKDRKDGHVTVPLPDDIYRTPGSVPFRWEIEPGVPKPHMTVTENEDSQAQDLESQSESPLRLPPSAYTPPTLKRRSRSSRGYLTWNISPGRRHLQLAASSHMRSIVSNNEYDGDDEDLDSNDECSPVSTLEIPESPRKILSPNLEDEGLRAAGLEDEGLRAAGLGDEGLGDEGLRAAVSSPGRSCATLLWGIFPCSSKCFFLPFSKGKEKTKQPWNGAQKKGNSVNCEAFQPVPSALKKKSRSSSWGGTKQVRFSVEDSHGNGNVNVNVGALKSSAVAAPNEMEWASYGLF